MFERILVVTDLSSDSDRVLGCLRGLKALGVSETVLVHTLGIRHLDEMKNFLAPSVEPRLQTQRAELEAQGFAGRYAIKAGLPGTEVRDAADEEHASMIVVSTPSTLTQDILHGRAALDILREARVPVLVVPRAAVHDRSNSRTPCPDFSRHVLYPTDFSDTAERAFGYVGRLVDGGARRVTILHVDRAPIGKHRDHLQESHQIDVERVGRLQTALNARGSIDVRVKVVFGSPAAEILRLARSADDTMIVMGSQGKGVVAEVFLGSVSHQVMRQAPVPVLLVPPVRKQAAVQVRSPRGGR